MAKSKLATKLTPSKQEQAPEAAFQDIPLDDGDVGMEPSLPFSSSTSTPFPRGRPSESSVSHENLLFEPEDSFLEDERLKSIEEENKKLLARLKAVEETASEALGELEDVKEKLRGESESKRTIVNQHDLLKKREKDLEAVIGGLKKDAEGQRATCEALESRLQLNIREKDEMEARVNTMAAASQAAMDADVASASDLSSRLTEVQSLLEASQAKCDQYEAKGRRAAKAANEYKAQLQEATDKLQEATERASEKLQEVSERAEKEIEQLALKAKQAEERLSLLSTSKLMGDLSAALDALKATEEGSSRVTEALLADLTTSLAALSTHPATSHIPHLAASMAVSSSSVTDEMERDLSEARRRGSEASDSNRKLSQEIELLTTRLKKTEEESSALRESYSQLEKILCESRAEVVALNIQLERSEAIAVDLKRELSHQSQASASLADERERVTLALESTSMADKKAADLAVDLEASESECKSLQLRIKDMEVEALRLRGVIEEGEGREGEIKALEDQLDALKLALRKREEELQEAAERLEKLQEAAELTLRKREEELQEAAERFEKLQEAAELTLRKREEELANQLKMLKEALEAEKESSLIAEQTFRAEAEVEIRKRGESQREKMRVEMEGLEDALNSERVAKEEKEKELKVMSQKLAMTEIRAKEAQGQNDRVSDMEALVSSLSSEAEALRKFQSESEPKIVLLQETISRMESEAIEKSRRFSMVHQSFKTKEEELKRRVEEAEEEKERALEQQRAASNEHVNEKDEEEERRRLQLMSEVEELRQGLSRVQVSLNDQVLLTSEAIARAVQAESLLLAERASRDQESGDDANLRRNFDRLLKAAVSEREEEAERRVNQALDAIRDSEQMAREAEERADRAEAQKIELSMALASRTDVEWPHRDTAEREMERSRVDALAGQMQDDGLLDELSRKAEEAELAAAVQTRRASAAESECDLLKLQLGDAQRQIKELSWQIKMTIGAGGGSAGSFLSVANQGRAGSGLSLLGSQTLDILGCGPSFARK